MSTTLLQTTESETAVPRPVGRCSRAATDAGPRAGARSARRSVPASPYTSDLAHLEDELDWVEVRLLRLEAQRQAVDIDVKPASDPGNGGHVADRALPHRTSAASTRSARLLRQEHRLRAAIDVRMDASRSSGQPVAMDRLAHLHGLSDTERTVLLLAAAPACSLRYTELLRRLQGGKVDALQVDTVFTFLGFDARARIEGRRLFAATGPLVANDLVKLDSDKRHLDAQALLTSTVRLAPRTFRYLAGDNGLGDEFQDCSSVEEPRATFDDVVLPPRDKQRILSVIERHDEYLACRRDWGLDEVIRYGRGILMLFHGDPGTGKTMTAHAVAHRMGRKVLTVDLPTLQNGSDAERILPGLFREARLQHAVLFFDECDQVFRSRLMGNRLLGQLLTEMERFEGIAVLATNLEDTLDPAVSRRILVRLHFPKPDRTTRLALWRRHLPPRVPLADDVDLEALASRYEMTGGLIKNAVLLAVADAFQAGGPSARVSMAQLLRASRDQMCDDVAFLKPRIARTGLRDVILPTDLDRQVHELVQAARGRAEVLERWGLGRRVGYGRGVSALMSGDPGTGKTFCAEAIAHELDCPLLVATLPLMLSQWVGETEKNLEKAFRQAKALGAVLLLDECDSFFTSRQSAVMANHDVRMVNVLLDLVERHEGVVLLATNLPQNLDGALARRLTYHLRFPPPDALLRARIWRSLLLPGVPQAPDVDPVRLGRRFAFAGGHIKNAVLKAAFRAAQAGGPLTQALLEEVAEEEAGAVTMGGKGRGVGFVVGGPPPAAIGRRCPTTASG